MATQHSCPKPDTLERLVQGRVSAQELAAIERHLDTCPVCAQSLDNLATSSDILLHALHVQKDAAAETPSAQVQTLILRLKGQVEGDTSTDTTAAELAACLTPPNGPEEIGRLGAFPIRAVLGSGGMGIVLEAEDVELKRRVAIKIIHPAKANSAEVRQRFVREAQAQAAIHDPHLVAIYQVGHAPRPDAPTESLPFLVMELLHGQSLARAVGEGRLLSVGEIVRVGRGVALALHALHGHGLVHRDVKPSNIWLEDAAGVKLLDYGLARTQEAESHLTQTGVIVGTPAFMAPEQASGANVDGRADLFSLGCVLYQMATGKHPYPGTNPVAILHALVSQRARPVEELNPALPPALGRLILRLIERDPNQRPATALEVSEALAEIERPTPRPASKRGLILATLGCVLLGIVLVVRERNGRVTQVIVPDGSTVTVAPAEQPLFRPLDVAWVERVGKLRGKEQLREVIAELQRRNPNFDGRHTPIYLGDVLMDLTLSADHLADIAPLGVLRELTSLSCAGSGEGKGRLRDLTPLAQLTRLDRLGIGWTAVSDLKPLKGLSLRQLRMPGTQVFDLTPLAGMPLESLHLWRTPVVNLDPLRGLKLKALEMHSTCVESVDALRGMPLETLKLEKTLVRDLRPLADLRLKTLSLDPERCTHLEVLRKMTSLQQINQQPVTDFWKAQPERQP